MKLRTWIIPAALAMALTTFSVQPAEARDWRHDNHRWDHRYQHRYYSPSRSSVSLNIGTGGYYAGGYAGPTYYYPPPAYYYPPPRHVYRPYYYGW